MLSVFERWLTNIGQKMSEGGSIDLEKDKVPFGVETVDEEERERQKLARVRLKRKQALRSAIDHGRICFLLYGGVTVNKDIKDKFVDGRLQIGNETGQRRMRRFAKSALSNDPKEGDYVFISIPAFVKLVPLGNAEEASAAYEEALKNTEAMEDPMVQEIMAQAQASMTEYGVELDVGYLDALSGDSLNQFIQDNKASIKEMDGYLFGGEDMLTFVETMLGDQLIVQGEDGKAYQRDCFAHTLTKVAQRLRYL